MRYCHNFYRNSKSECNTGIQFRNFIDGLLGWQRSITADDIDHAPGLSLEELLVTRVPGLTLSRAPDGHLVIHIRGTSTLLGDEEPLFVVNGLALETPIGGNLWSINPHDIESITVLRDAASTAMYGVRGANGVIVIKTKQS